MLGGGPVGASEPETTLYHGRDLGHTVLREPELRGPGQTPAPVKASPARPPPSSQGLRGQHVPHLPPVLPRRLQLPGIHLPGPLHSWGRSQKLCPSPGHVTFLHTSPWPPVPLSQDSHGCREPGGLQLLDGRAWMRPNCAPGLPAASPSPPPSRRWLPTPQRESSNSLGVNSLGVHWGHLGELWYPEGKRRTSPEGDVP